MATQEGRDAIFIGQDTRTDFKQIIAKRSDLARFAHGRIVKPGADNTTYQAGLVLGQVTAAGPNQGRWAAYNPAATDGSQVAKGILASATLADTNDNGTEISVLTGGCAVYQDRLIGLDAAAITALGAKSFVETGFNILELG
jgi:hypothetical protein